MNRLRFVFCAAMLASSFAHSQTAEAPAEAAPAEATPTEAAPAEAAPTEAAPVPAAEDAPAATDMSSQDPGSPPPAPEEGTGFIPEVGSSVGAYTLLAVNGGSKRLPSGDFTAEPCGFEVDVIVEKNEKTEKAVLEVPCKSGSAELIPGQMRLRFAEAKKAPVKKIAEGEPTAADLDGEIPRDKKGILPRAPDAAFDPNNFSLLKKPFLKGELTKLGIIQVTNERMGGGVGLGIVAIDNVYYGQVRPDLNLYFGKFGLGIGAPFRVQILNLNLIDPLAADPIQSIFQDAGKFRTEDWDEKEEWFRPIKFISWGKKEDDLFISLNRVYPVTIGHGQLMRRYSSNVNVNESNLILEFDAYDDFGGIELMGGPFPIPRLMGGLMFIKPLGPFFDNYMAKSLSIGASYMTDINTPTQLTTITNPADGRVQLPVTDTGDFLYDSSNANTGPQVHGAGVDTELKVFRNEDFDLKVYGDYSRLFLPGVAAANIQPFSDGGFTAGGILRVSLGKRPVRSLKNESDSVQMGYTPRELQADHAFRIRFEGRTFGPQYLPSFFDTLYEADKYQFGFNTAARRAQVPTKVGYLASQKGGSWRLGQYIEASYQYVGYFGFTLVYEDAMDLGTGQSVAAARNFALHVESYGLGWLQLFLSYHIRHFDDATDMFKFNTQNEVVYGGGRLMLTPGVYLNIGGSRSFQLGFLPDDLPSQKRSVPGDASGDTFRYTSVGQQPVWTVNADLEFGWQF